VAARGESAAASKASDWISPWRIACRLDGPAAWISSGLKAAGFVDGENVAIVYRFAEDQPGVRSWWPISFAVM